MNEVVEKITSEIMASGAIPFARFMELALYCPVYGYYEKEKDTIGRHGDYYTSVSVGSLFGELLAFQFAEWLKQSKVQSPKSKVQSQIVEAGAHDGRLAKDILKCMGRHRAELLECLDYIIIEPSFRRRQWQQETLGQVAKKVRWVTDLAAMATRPALELASRSSDEGSPLLGSVRGIIFSNELLDAFPVHRLGWDANRRAWFEWGVTLQDGRFAWTRMTPPKSKVQSPKPTVHSPQSTVHSLEQLPDELLGRLPDGFTIESCPAAEAWWRDAASVLGSGKLLTVDYGLTAEEFLMPERNGGTLRGYHHHRLCDDVLANPGEQDLTAHVNFTAIQSAGESAGLKTEVICGQAQFLTQIASRAWNSEPRFGEWTAKSRRQFQTLTHPEHLGRSFRVLVQSRGAG